MTRLILIPEPPRFPATRWLCEFASHVMAAQPGLRFGDAMRCAMLAHQGTWLLDPEEAAELWLAAIQAEGAARRLPRDLAG